MSSLGPATQSVFTPRVLKTVERSTILNLVNLILRDTNHRITVLQTRREAIDMDPEVYVVTRMEWRCQDTSEPLVLQLPRLLSILETLRGMESVPSEIHLDSTDGFTTYLTTEEKVSELPKDSKKCVEYLVELVEHVLVRTYITIRDVERWFWISARKKGFSRRIVKKLPEGRNPDRHMHRFYKIMENYFSIRFNINRENMLFWEE